MVDKVNPLLATVQQTPDPIDTVDISDVDFAPTENPLDISFKQAADTEPDRIAATIKTARALDQPPEVVERNFDAAKKAAERPSSDYFADIIKDNPRVAKFLSDPQAMAVAKDDIPSLVDFSDTVKESVNNLNPANFPGARPEDYQKMSSDIVAGWKSGRLNVRQAQVGWTRLLATMQTGEWSQFGEEDLAAIDKESAAQPPAPKGFAPFYFAGQQLPNFGLMAQQGLLRGGQAAAVAGVGALGVSALAGPAAPAAAGVTVPAAMTAGFGLGGKIGVAEASAILEGGLAFDEFSKIRDVNGKQVDPRQAAQMALGVGIINAGLEYASAAALLRTIPGGQKILGMIGNKSVFKKMTPGIAVREAAKRYLESVGTEVATEMGQEATVVEGGNLLKQLSGEPFEPAPEGAQLARVLSVASPTAQATALMGIPGSAIHIISDVQAMNRANKAQEIYTSLEDQASKLRQRDDVMHEEHVADVVKGTPVETIYVDARAAEKYFQSKNIDLAAVSKELGIEPGTLQDAVSRGGDIQVAYSKWSSKLGGTEHYMAMAGDVKFDPNERTINQAAAKATETASLLTEQAQAAAEADPSISEGMDFIYNDIKQKMKLSGAYKEDKTGEALLDSNAKVFAAAIVNLPDRGTMNPKEFYQSMLPLEVQGQGETPAGALQQSKKSSKALEDRAVKRFGLTDDPTKTAYILSDGRMLDFSTKGKVGYGPLFGHNAVQDIFTPSDLIKMDRAQEEGKFINEPSQEFFVQSSNALRVDFSDPSNKHWQVSSWANPPTDSQLAAIREAVEIRKPKTIMLEWGDKFKEVKNPTAEDIQKFFRGTTLFQSGAATLDQIVDEAQQVRAQESQKQIKSPKFRKWFGDSVITEDGKKGSAPTVMYHGTPNDFTEFKAGDDIGIHVGTATQANDRIAYKQFISGTMIEGINVKPLFVKLDNPIELHDIGDWTSVLALQDALIRVASLEKYIDRINNTKSIAEIRAFLKERGFDGIKYLNEWESGSGAARFEGVERDELTDDEFNELVTHEVADPEYSYIVFSPGQLKSAIGNRGTFDPKKHSILMQGTPDEPRGFIEFSDKKTIIGLLKADASTFMHETAHFWLKNFAAYVDAGLASEKHLKDWKILSDWLKIPEGKVNLTVDQQEQFARGFEAYLREGVAPSEGLRVSFRRFSRWLTKLYRDIRQLNVDLTQDVRSVFDRMLASDDEIAFARRHMGLDLVPNLEGIDPAVVQKLTDLRREAHDQAFADLLRKQMKELRPDKREQYNAALKEKRTEIEADVRQMPEYQSMDAIRRSNMQIKDANAAAVAFLEKKMTPEDRVSFRMISSLQGYSSAQEMAKKILEAPQFAQEVNRRVEFAMQEFADLKDTDKIKEEAVKTLATEKQTELLAYERAMFLALVDQAQNNAAEIRTRKADAKIEADTAKLKAIDIISKTPVNKAVSFMPYFTAARNAATEAYIAAKAGKFEVAAEAKRRQMLNHALATEAFRQRQSIEKWRAYLHTLELKDKALFKREEHFNQVAALMSRFGIERKDYDPAKRTETLQAWNDRMIEQEGAVNIPDWLMDESVSKPWRELTVSEMHDVIDALKNIQHVANQENTFYRVMQGATIENTVLDLEKEAAANNKANPVELIERRRGFFDSAKRFLRGYDSQLRTAENIALRIGGWKDGSLWYRVLWRSAETAGNAESDLMAPFAARYKAILEKHYTAAERKDMVDDDEQILIPEWNQSVRKISLVMMALNLGTESNRARLFESRIVGVDPAIAWDEQSVMAVLQKNLKANDWRFAQDVWDMINSLWPQMAEMHKEVTGFSPEKVDPVSFRVQTVDGEQVLLNGGYFPLKADTRANLLTEIREKLDAPLYTEQNPAFVASTKNGHLKARKAQAKYPVALEISTIQRHLQDAVHDVAWRPTIIDLRRLINNQAFRQLMLTYGTAEDYSALRDWVGSAAVGNQKEQAVLSFWDTMMRTLKNNFTGAVIVLNPKIVFQNVSNVFLYAGAVDGFGWSDVVSGMMQKGLAYTLGSLSRSNSAKQSRDFVFGKSSFMRDKESSADYSLNDTADAMFGKQHPVKNFFKGAMSSFDELTSIPMWRTAYEKGIATGKTETESVEFADNLIRRSIGSARKYQTSGIFRSGETAKTFAILYGFMSAQKNRWERERGILGKDYIANSPRFLGYLFSHFVVFAAMSQIMSGNLPDFEDEDKLKRWLKSLLLYRLQMEPGVGQMANVVADNAFGLNSFGYRPIPQVAVPEKVILAMSKTIGAIKGDAEPKDAAEAITHALTFTTGTPDQMANWFWNIFDIAVEGMEPQAGDLLRRRPKAER